MKSTEKIDKDSKTKTHWKSFFDYKYLGSQDLDEGQDLILTIKSFQIELVEGERGEKECIICEFEEDVKNMIINKVNFKSISKVYNSKYVEDFIGKRIQVYAKQNVKAFGKVVEALRIREFKPKPTKKPNLKKEEYSNAIDNFKKFGNLDNVKLHRTVTAQQEKEIIELSKAK